MQHPMLDLRLVQSFLVLADERSFTRAAERIGVAQSAMSMRIRRLEDVLRFSLISRTSRRVALTPEGLAFLPHARALIAAETEARAAAREIVATQGDSLRVGSYGYLAKVRSQLINRYIAIEPKTEILVAYGTRDELLQQLRLGAIDAIIGLSRPEFVEDGVAIHPVSRLHAHIVMPPDDPLFDAAQLSLADLAGRSLAVMPSWVDGKVMGYFADLMTVSHLKPIAGPEPEKDALSSYARMRGLPHLVWFSRRRPRRLDRDWAVIALSDEAMTADVTVIVNREPTPRGARFLEALQKTAEPA